MLLAAHTRGGVSDSKTHHAILRHEAPTFFPGPWGGGGDGDYGLIKQKTCVVTLRRLTISAFGTSTWIFALVHLIAGRLEFF